MSLLTQDSDADLQLLTPSDATPSSDGKGPSKRGSNYTHEEDIQLCISWMNVSNDPIVANDQPSKSYYQRIADDFHKNKDFESSRSTKSLEIRIAGIIKDCMKFQSFYEEIERRHPSSVPHQEHVLIPMLDLSLGSYLVIVIYLIVYLVFVADDESTS